MGTGSTGPHAVPQCALPHAVRDFSKSWPKSPENSLSLVRDFKENSRK